MSINQNDVKKFLIDHIEEHSTDLVRFAAAELGVSRQAVSQHINKFIKDGTIEGVGKGKNRQFRLQKTLHTFSILITSETDEDLIWRKQIKPVLPVLSREVENICYFGFTEMFNNVIDHSNSETAHIEIKYDTKNIEILLQDMGIGIFNKIKQKFNLSDTHQALLELAKGKLTTDPTRHTGEGVFFTSRVFDLFLIASGGLVFSHDNSKEVLSDAYSKESGTTVTMKIALNSGRTLKEIFVFFANNPDDLTFDKTIVPIRLAVYEGEQLVSRSQAKRVMTRLEKFKEVILDFENVSFIGRAFVDEIFRVYKNQHPEISLSYMNATAEIKILIENTLKISAVEE